MFICPRTEKQNTCANVITRKNHHASVKNIRLQNLKICLNTDEEYLFKLCEIYFFVFLSMLIFVKLLHVYIISKWKIWQELRCLSHVQSVSNLWPCSLMHLSIGWGDWYLYFETTGILQSAGSWPSLWKKIFCMYYIRNEINYFLRKKIK